MGQNVIIPTDLQKGAKEKKYTVDSARQEHVLCQDAIGGNVLGSGA